MTLLEEVLLYDEYEDLGGISATTFNKPTYQVYMEKTYGKIEESPEDKVAIQLGNGFHFLSEKAVGCRANLELEKTLMAKFNGSLITGTPDVIDTIMQNVQDWKVKGPYQFQKVFRGELEELIVQLSIYRWLYKRSKEIMLSDTAIAHVVCAGWQANSMRIQKKYKDEYPSLEFYPKHMSIDVPLLSLQETEDMMSRWIERYEMQSISSMKDCEEWRCNYCSAKCVSNPKYKGE